MSDRNLRERERALQQRLATSEGRIRALGLRAWPGAMRSAKGEYRIDIAAGPPTAYVLTTVDIPAGRWYATGRASISSSTVAAVPDIFALQIAVNSLVDGVLNLLDVDTTVAYTTMPATPAAEVQNQTLNAEGDIILDTPARVALAINDYFSRDFSVFSPRLRLLPV